MKLGRYYMTFVGLAIASNAMADGTRVTDHYKDVLYKTPYNVEVCTDVQRSGDKTGDALAGAIIGGIIGNNIKGEKDGGAIGALLGGMLGHSNSTAGNGTERTCRVETRYREVLKNVYDYSTVTFDYEGRSYSVKFKKKRY